MSVRISKAEFAKMLGVHEKTLEGYIKKPEFCEATGYSKNKLNGRVEFDRQFATIYAAELTGDDSLRTNEPEQGFIDAEVVTGSELATVEPQSIERRGRESMGGFELAAAISSAFIMPHKLLLTPAEARDLSGLSKKRILTRSQKIDGRWKIHKDELARMCSELSAKPDNLPKGRRVKK